MTFKDIFKSSFLENVTGVSLLDMAIALVFAFGLGVFIFFIYNLLHYINIYQNYRRVEGIDTWREVSS